MSKVDIYTVGGTVQVGHGLYIPRKADDELLELCCAGSFAYVLTPRQLGKSSLMVRTAERLAEKEIRSVIIDLSGIGVQLTAEQWYLGLLAEIEGQLELNTNVLSWWRERENLGITQRLTLFFQEVLLKEVSAPVVIFVDEIDTTLSLNFTDDFFAAIRYFYNARAISKDVRRLSFVLIGVATPGDLIRDPQRTPFNIGQRVDLTDFTFEEALPLAAGLGLADREARQVLDWVMKWTCGHPYLTQRLCRAVAAQHQNDPAESDVDRVVASTFLGEKSKQDDNLRFVRAMLTERTPTAVELGDVFQTYREVQRGRQVPDEEQSLVKSHLKLSGVVRRENAMLHVRNPIYEQVFNRNWIKQHLPKSYLQKNLRRTLAVAGVLALFALILAPLAVIAFVRGREAEQQRASAQEQTKQTERQRQIAEILRLEAERQRDIANQQAKVARQSESKLKQTQAQALIRAREAERERKRAVASEHSARISQQQAQDNFRKLEDANQRDKHSLDGLAAFQRNDYERALEEFTRALAILNKASSKADDRVRGQTLAHIGAVQRRRLHTETGPADFDQAITPYQQALTIHDKALDQSDWVLFDTIQGLAHAYDDAQRYWGYRGQGPTAFEAAEKYYLQAITFLREKVNEKELTDRAPLANALEDLARLYGKRDRGKDAGPVYEEVRSIRRLKAESSEYRRTLIEIARFYQSRGNYAQAAITYEELISVLEEKLKQPGLDSEEEGALIEAYIDLGTVYQIQRDDVKETNAFKMSRLLQEMLLTRRRQVSAPNQQTQSDFDLAMDAVADKYLELEKYDLAEWYYTWVRSNRAGKTDESVADSLRNFVNLYLKRRDYAKAEESYNDLIEFYTEKDKTFANSTKLAEILESLGDLYAYEMNKFTEAEAVFKRALRLYDELQRDPYRILTSLAIIYRRQGNTRELIQVERRRWEIARGVVRRVLYFMSSAEGRRNEAFWTGPTYDSAASQEIEAFNGLIDALLAQNQVADAKADFKGLLEERELVFGNMSDPEVLESYARAFARYRDLLRKEKRNNEAAHVEERIKTVKARQIQVSQQKQ